MTPQHRRSSDPPPGNWRIWRNSWRWWVWYGERIWQDVIPLFALGIAFYAVLHLNAEAAERRDQNCIVFERDAVASKSAYVAAKQQLDSTTQYLENLSPAEAKTGINKAIQASLTRVTDAVDQRWNEANAAKAPAYCDVEGVGLAEPNPALPARPR